MPTDDVVAELDAWLDENVTAIIDCTVVRRARDEIVALRRTIRLGPDLPERARIEALEEAAQACVGSGAIVAEARLCASAIRALKGQA